MTSGHYTGTLLSRLTTITSSAPYSAHCKCIIKFSELPFHNIMVLVNNLIFSCNFDTFVLAYFMIKWFDRFKLRRLTVFTSFTYSDANAIKV